MCMAPYIYGYCVPRALERQKREETIEVHSAETDQTVTESDVTFEEELEAFGGDIEKLARYLWTMNKGLIAKIES